MKRGYRLENLDTNVGKHFERNASRCLIRAVAFSLLIAIVVAIVTFIIFDSRMASIFVFGGVGFVSLNMFFLILVPSSKSQKQSHALIMAAAKAPDRIEDIRPGVIAVQTEEGQTHTLSTVERQAWQELVVPFLCKQHSKTLADQKNMVGHVLSRSEMSNLHDQRKAIKDDEARIQQDRLQLARKRADISALQERLINDEKELQNAREDIQLRSDALLQAEDLVISRLSEIEVAEAQMEQMQENLSAQQGSGESSALDLERLKRKEQEIDALRLSLQEDKHVVELQKTELNQLKGELIRESDMGAAPDLSPEDSLRIREQELESKLENLKAATSELETRSQYVQEVEDSLIDRLNSMSEREAFIEQGEVEAGVRTDD
ncbi:MULTISPECIES: hypothetical protein [unclassified Lentimonas]|uniref:hypothetical protein n=1 Tax=unclassified Lentimonas TaxID=2630993 RepID=UPI00132A993B|nr:MULTISPECIES: hypothetical protein [unclassified Lentimonas]CAA6678409.1 Unannotated [Lentimonas sp. CC4]CAA6685501.1 Unannotated [Lentimonas sp. CC6]CAA6690515.1 Unannotated [Lentimonas sp. CC10]CAA6693263.1 Unannotated [Lentimonas sp. CC19]CAA7068772.1 Unannotated [Lentimonas sp. CC11]